MLTCLFVDLHCGELHPLVLERARPHVQPTRYTHAKSERKLAGATRLDVAYVTRGVPLNRPVTTSPAVVPGTHDILCRCPRKLRTGDCSGTFDIAFLLHATTLTADKRPRRKQCAPRRCNSARVTSCGKAPLRMHCQKAWPERRG